MVKKRILAKDGATILLALLFFLMCAVAGSVVIAAGSAASGRVSGLAEQEQSFYTVTSAAKIIREEMTGTMTVTENPDGYTAYAMSPEVELKGMIGDAVKSVREENRAYADTFTISVTASGEDNGFPEVTGEFRMDTEYGITVVLQRNDDDDTYVCSVVMPASVKEIGDTGLQTQISWSQGKIVKEH